MASSEMRQNHRLVHMSESPSRPVTDDEHLAGAKKLTDRERKVYPSTQLKDTDLGLGRMLLNYANPEDPSYPHPLSPVLEVLVDANGHAPLSIVAEKTGLPLEEVKTKTDIRGVFHIATSENGEEIEAPSLTKYLQQPDVQEYLKKRQAKQDTTPIFDAAAGDLD